MAYWLSPPIPFELSSSAPPHPLQFTASPFSSATTTTPPPPAASTPPTTMSSKSSKKEDSLIPSPPTPSAAATPPSPLSASTAASTPPPIPSTSIGNLLGIIVLSWFLRCGHHVIALVGGATGRVADPSGRSWELRNKELHGEMEGTGADVASNLGKRLSFSLPRGTTSSPSCTPNHNVLKINVDVAISPGEDHIGVAMVARNSQGVTIWWARRSIDAPTTFGR
ncbi:hypothetical protein CASFOL_038451 [Castilleja foliolosa]|uniref:Uncharacterized protein n=1 Tax=Castilleja foliolosa TaxID=1961234 RepID=A0ABD3BN39_9LAMI